MFDNKVFNILFGMLVVGFITLYMSDGLTTVAVLLTLQALHFAFFYVHRKAYTGQTIGERLTPAESMQYIGFFYTLLSIIMFVGYADANTFTSFATTAMGTTAAGFILRLWYSELVAGGKDETAEKRANELGNHMARANSEMLGVVDSIDTLLTKFESLITAVNRTETSFKSVQDSCSDFAGGAKDMAADFVATTKNIKNKNQTMVTSVVNTHSKLVEKSQQSTENLTASLLQSTKKTQNAFVALEKTLQENQKSSQNRAAALDGHVQGTLESLNGGIETFKASIDAVIEAHKSQADAIAATPTGLGQLNQQMQAITSAAAQLNRTIGSISNAYGSTDSQIKAASESMQKSAKSFEDSFSHMANVLGGAFDTAAAKANELGRN